MSDNIFTQRFKLPGAEPEGAPQPGNNRPVQSVSEVSQAVKRTIESTFGEVRIRGEISRPTYARSGHLYLTLKDENAVIDVVAWRGTVSKLPLRAEEGMEIIADGRLTTYPGSGKYQLVMNSFELAGEGALLKLLEDRRRRLTEEGLFDPARKQPLPFMPKVIGVVSSPTGAVIRDIMHRLNDRFPVRVLLWPVKVQGKGADAEIARAIDGFNAITGLETVPRPDLLIVARGGGSLEDLWSFNEENVVRAAAASRIPLISAVGHETDTTLIDFASDQRAPTPTAAAEMAVPVRRDLFEGLQGEGQRMTRAFERGVTLRQTALEGLARGLIHPGRRLEDLAQKLDDLSERLYGAMPRLVDAARQRLENLHPVARLKAATVRQHRLASETVQRLGQQLEDFAKLEEKALARGYARVSTPGGQIIARAASAPDGLLRLTFADGALDVRHGGGDSSSPAAPAVKPKPKKKTPSAQPGPGLFDDL